MSSEPGDANVDTGGHFTPNSKLARTPPQATKRKERSPAEGLPGPSRLCTEAHSRSSARSAAVQASHDAKRNLTTPARPPAATPAPAAPEKRSQGASQPGELRLATASKLELLDCVRGAIKNIVAITSGPGSKLNKADIGGITANGHEILGAVAAIELQLADAERRAEVAEARLASSSNGQLVAASAAVAPDQPSFANALKMGKGQLPKPIKTQGPVLAFYPREEAETNTSESTKAELKRAVDPRTISVQVEGVRKVGNAGVMVQTASVAAAERLKKAVPASLRVVEPKRKQPLVALHNVDGDPSFEALVDELWELNLRENPLWPLPKVREEMKGAFKRSRKGGLYKETTCIFECTPGMREALINLGTVYIGWQHVEVNDFIRVTCCNKCQMYGHPEKFCRAKDPTCGLCGEAGHRAEQCKSPVVCCATCKRFKRESTHRTASRCCPARLHAEEQLIQQVQYG